MQGLDEWITGHYGEDQWLDLFCPSCGCNVDDVGYEEVEGTFTSGVFIYKCDGCDALVQEGCWLSYNEAREKFA